jgi:hypothetical protein
LGSYCNPGACGLYWEATLDRRVAAMNHLPKGARRAGRFITATVALLTSAASVSLGQHPTSDAAKVRMENDSKRESQLRANGAAPTEAVDPKRLKAVMEEVEQDFKRILVLHNDMVRATTADQRLDYSFVSDAAGEIKKRASRLQTTLALNKPEGAEQSHEKRMQFSDAQVKDALIELCKEIESFVRNPVIESPGTVDVQQTARAVRDLESVIDLSGRIKKTADKLARSSK